MAPDPPAGVRPAARRRAQVARIESRAPQDGGIAAVVESVGAPVDLASWLRAEAEDFQRLLLAHGAVLLRGFAVRGGLASAVAATGGAGALPYRFASTDRSRVSGNVYTSTEYPPDQAIPLHNELSYAPDWPMRLWFWCERPATDGGATPLADSRRVLQRIDPAVRDRFAALGVRYVRNYGSGVDLPWSQVFETADRAEVERFCARAGIDLRWDSDDRLRTWHRGPAIERHPVTGEAVWFNQAHLFHLSSLPEDVRRVLVATHGEDGVPRSATFGDGSAIPVEALDHIRDAYRVESTRFSWRADDVLVVDNMLVAHGRDPFRGPRRLLVAMDGARHGLLDAAGSPS